MENYSYAKTNFYQCETLGYSSITKLLKDFWLVDSQKEFEQICTYLIINKPTFLPIILSDEDIAPYLTGKYINLLIRYVKKSITPRLLF